MESKLLVGGKNIVDHTNEQQKILEQKRQEIAEQVTCHSLWERMEWGGVRQCYRANISSVRLFKGYGKDMCQPLPGGRLI